MLLFDFTNNLVKFNYTVICIRRRCRRESIQIQFAQPSVSILITIYF